MESNQPQTSIFDFIDSGFQNQWNQQGKGDRIADVLIQSLQNQRIPNAMYYSVTPYDQ